MKREAEIKRATMLLILGIILMIAGTLLSSFIARTIGKTTSQKICFENFSSNLVSATLYKPRSFSRDELYAGIVMVPGEYDNKETLEYAATELARSGTVVLAIDNQGHGDTGIDISTPESRTINDFAIYLSDLSYIDKTKIGVVGFSKFACDMINQAVIEDNRLGSNSLFSAILYVAGDPMYTNGNVYANVYEGRHVGLISAKYDDLSHHREIMDNGTPRYFASDFITSFDAMSFLNFGRDPSRLPIDSPNQTNTIYRYADRENGAIRVIYTTKVFRSEFYYSPNVIRRICDFFAQGYGIKSGSVLRQLTVYRNIFGLFSVIGFVLFVMSASILLAYTQFFADVSLLNDNDDDYIAQPMRIQESDYKGRLWFWLSAAAGFIVTICTCMRVMGFGYKAFRHIAQRQTFAVSCWLFVAGIVLLGIFLLWFRFYSSVKGYNLVRMGIIVPKVVLGKTILLSILVAMASYMMAFLCEYMFAADIRFYNLIFKGFNVTRLVKTIFPYMFLMVVYFVSLSIFQNVIMYNNIFGKYNTLFVAFYTALPASVLIIIQFFGFVTNGRPVFFNAFVPYNEFVLWLIPVVFTLFASSFVSRYIFERTKNNYFSGIINAILITLLIASNTKMI